MFLGTPTRSRMSPTASLGNSSGNTSPPPSEPSDWQFVVLVSEKQARVIALPSQTCVFKQSLVTDPNMFIIKAEVVQFKGNFHALCYIFSQSPSLLPSQGF